MMITRVSDLHYVALAVPDLAAERNFFGEIWGLVEVAEDDGKIYFAAEGSTHPYAVRLREDPERKTDMIGFSAEASGAVDRLFEQVKTSGAQFICEPALMESFAGGYGFRFFDPDGRAIEVTCDRKQRSARTLVKGEAIPSGISHIVLHTPNPAQLLSFYEDVLGFRLSDQIGHFMYFLRCNKAHHRLAILPGAPALNHIAFDVSSVDEMMRGLARLAEAGVNVQWGPGRHTAGNNMFSYFSTPNGNTVEYTSDLEEVDEDSWIPTTYEMTPAVIDQWGTGRIISGDVQHKEIAPDAGLWKTPS